MKVQVASCEWCCAGIRPINKIVVDNIYIRVPCGVTQDIGSIIPVIHYVIDEFIYDFNFRIRVSLSIQRLRSNDIPPVGCIKPPVEWSSNPCEIIESWIVILFTS